MLVISMKKKNTHQKTIYACHRLRIGDRVGKESENRGSCSLNYISCFFSAIACSNAVFCTA